MTIDDGFVDSDENDAVNKHLLEVELLGVIGKY
jgi:hypothetical protein